MAYDESIAVLWIVARDEGGAVVEAHHALTRLGVKALSVVILPTMDMPGTWLAEIRAARVGGQVVQGPTVQPSP